MTEQKNPLAIMQAYEAAEAALFEHVGFTPDWVMCPISDCTESYWYTDGETVVYAETMEKMESDGNYYQDDIYTQRFYEKWIYEGKDLTMIFCDPHVDGVKWFRVFDNTKRVKSYGPKED